MVFQVIMMHCKAILSRGRSGIMRWILVRIYYMPQMQDRSVDLLTCSSACYHYAATSWIYDHFNSSHVNLPQNVVLYYIRAERFVFILSGLSYWIKEIKRMCRVHQKMNLYWAYFVNRRVMHYIAGSIFVTCLYI